MDDDEQLKLRGHSYRQSRIPHLDALEFFVPDGAPPDPELEAQVARTGFSRWHPVAGGHRVLVLHEGGAFNADRFRLLTGAWDHEHCKRCSSLIPAMTLCWVSRGDVCVILCVNCYQIVFPEQPD